MTFAPSPHALFFDVFGTCVDWRTTVVRELQTESCVALNSATASLASAVRLRASSMSNDNWAAFAQEWRDSYKSFTRQLAKDASIPWMSVDEHHLVSLKDLMVKWQLDGLWDDEQLGRLSMVWHHLIPWVDSAAGVTLLNTKFHTCTLSNGNISLLDDLRTFSQIPFKHLFSAELFGTYKPASAVYLGAVEKLQLSPSQCVMVAAHLNDLKAAKDNGLLTIYVERPGEEEWDIDQIEQARKDGFVDVWISNDGFNRGFISVAERLGIDITNTSETY